MGDGLKKKEQEKAKYLQQQQRQRQEKTFTTKKIPTATTLMFQLLPLVLLETTLTNAFPSYADELPNGRSVPNPGPQGGVWAGVGHQATASGGPRNVFGIDFLAQGHVWTQELCRMDSDGDGRSNGVELGDPDCVWTRGDTPRGPALSHPGIVDEPRL